MAHNDSIPVLVRGVLHVRIKHRVLHLGVVGRGLRIARTAVVVGEVGEIVGVLVAGVSLGLGLHHLWPLVKMILGGRVQVGHGVVVQTQVIISVGGHLRQVALFIDAMNSSSSTLGFCLDGHLVGTGLVGVFLLVMIQVGSCGERMTTGLTLVWLLPRVDTLVDLQIWLLGEVLATVGAFELLRYFMVLSYMTLQVAPTGKLHTTKGALGRTASIAVLVPHVFVQSCFPPTSKLTLVTGEVLAAMELLRVLS